jgi:hypothetical protein
MLLVPASAASQKSAVKLGLKAVTKQQEVYHDSAERRSWPTSPKSSTESCNRADINKTKACPHRGPAAEDENLGAEQDATHGYVFEDGVHYPLIQDRLYFSQHPDDAYTFERIHADKRLFYFSSTFPGAFGICFSMQSKIVATPRVPFCNSVRFGRAF